MSLENIIANTRRESDDLRPQLGASAFFHIFNNEVTPGNGYVIVSTRGLGSSFILGHGSWGRLGTVADGSQPVLGDSRGTWGWLRVEGPDRVFTEYFLGSTFMSGNTTANWAEDGSCTGAGSAVSNPVYLGSQELGSATLTASGTGGPYYMAADGTNWEAVTSATTHTFSSTGSDLRWKANIQDGSTLFKVEVDY